MQNEVRCANGHRVMQPEAYAELFKRFASRQQECFFVSTLNGAHEVMKTRVVTMGLVNRTMVHPREVFRDAIRDNASAIIVAHNHPSGSVDPSPEDLNITERLVEAAEIVGIPVLDHIIFAKKHDEFVHTSLRVTTSIDFN